MRITVIGAGNIGGTLGRKWAAAGHQVVFGVREPQAAKVQALLTQAGANASASTPRDAIEAADIVVFAIPAGSMASLIADLGEALNGKTLIDTTNMIGQTPMHSLPQLHAVAPDSPLFRAFSNLGWENFNKPAIDGVQVDLFYCGDAGPAQAIVDSLIADVGLRPIYVGGNDQADLIDALTRLWFITAMQQGRGRHLAFKMLG